MIGPAFGGLAAGISVQAAFFLAALLALANFASVFFQVREPKEKAESKAVVAQEITLLEHIKSPILLLFLASFMTAFMIGGLDATLAIFLNEKLGFTATQMGLVFAYIGALIFIMQYFTGRLVNRFGEKKLVSAGLFLSATGFLLLLFVTSWVELLFPLLVFVLGNALVFPSVTSLITKRVVGKRGAVLGLTSSFNSLGQMIGPLLGGFLYGFNHAYSFAGLAAVTLAYLVLFVKYGWKIDAQISRLPTG